MTSSSSLELSPIRRALISVSDKTGIVEFARELQRFHVEIISTGGTARVLRDAGIEVRDVADLTGFPEMMDGRVKTLHPRIHGALLGLRANPVHQEAMRDHGIEPIDMVVANLYPFEQTIVRAGVTREEAIEQIDIGGPAMIRSAAKNWLNVTVIATPRLYHQVSDEIRRHRGATTLGTRERLARLAFEHTAAYDTAISGYLASCSGKREGGEETLVDSSSSFAEASGKLPPSLDLTLVKIEDLRYGENPHQLGALYATGELGGIAEAKLLSGKEMSFNNYVDADAAWRLVCDFQETACAIIKHTNPAGVALGKTPEEAYRKALDTDPVSAFGGIVAFNCTLDAAAAGAAIEVFTEVVIAPDYEAEALATLRTRKNLRVLKASLADGSTGVELRQISGGILVQTADAHRLTSDDLKVVTKRQPTEDEIRALLFAWIVCKHTKSNAIVYAHAGQTVGVGAGQMSRVDSVKLGAMRARLSLQGSVLASDAFFPFRDGIDEASKHGITAVIQPGGSVRDMEVVAAADEHHLAMVLTGVRHFRH